MSIHPLAVCTTIEDPGRALCISYSACLTSHTNFPPRSQVSLAFFSYPATPCLHSSRPATRNLSLARPIHSSTPNWPIMSPLPTPKQQPTPSNSLRCGKSPLRLPHPRQPSLQRTKPKLKPTHTKIPQHTPSFPRHDTSVPDLGRTCVGVHLAELQRGEGAGALGEGCILGYGS